MLNALTLAARLFPDEDIRSAAFGVFEKERGDSTSLWQIRPIQVDAADLAGRTPGDEAKAILAIGLENAFRIRLGDDPQVEAIPVCDLSAKAEEVEGQWLVRMKPASVLTDRLGVAFAADFRITQNDPWKPSGLAGNLVDALARTGDALGSSHPLLRFIARSIHAIQVNNPNYVSRIVPDEIRWKAKHSSISGFMGSMDEEGWLESFVRAFEVEAPEDGEIFLQIEPGQWILTDRRLCLLGGFPSVRTVPLAEVRRYSVRGLFTLGVDISLESGERIRWSGSNLLSEKEFSRCLNILRESRALPAATVHAHGG